MISKAILISVIVTAIHMTGMTASWAQGTDDADKTREIVIDSRPTGAAIYLEGAYTIVGRTPLKLKRTLVGPYKIRSWKYGYEEYSSRIQFTGDSETILIRLRRKTPLKAGLRSFVFPGWGQAYSGQRLKGVLISTAQLGTVIATLVAHSDYLQARDDYKAALREFDRKKKDFRDRESLLDNVASREQQRDRAFDRRRTWLWITGSVWVFNLLDAVFLFPRDHSRFYDMQLSPLSATIEPGVARLSLTMRF